MDTADRQAKYRTSNYKMDDLVKAGLVEDGRCCHRMQLEVHRGGLAPGVYVIWLINDDVDDNDDLISCLFL